MGNQLLNYIIRYVIQLWIGNVAAHVNVTYIVEHESSTYTSNLSFNNLII